VYETTSVDTAVTSLSAAVNGAMEQAIPHGYSCRSKFPPWFIISTVAFKKKPSDYFYDRFTIYRKLVKYTIKSDRLRWLKSIDNTL
jgi:hypothetical protein